MLFIVEVFLVIRFERIFQRESIVGFATTEEMANKHIAELESNDKLKNKQATLLEEFGLQLWKSHDIFMSEEWNAFLRRNLHAEFKDKIPDDIINDFADDKFLRSDSVYNVKKVTRLV